MIHRCVVAEILSFTIAFYCADEENGLDGVGNAVLEAQRNLVVYIDIYRIEQVIRNLITNAVFKTPSL